MVPYETMHFWNILCSLLILCGLFCSSSQKAYGDIYYPEEPAIKKEPDAPVFRPTEQNCTVGPGTKAKLKCRVDNLGTKTVTWRREKDKHPLTIGLFTYVADDRITIDYNQRTNEWTLFIQDVTPEDEGTYLCTISTKEHRDKFYPVHLTVKTVQVDAVGSTFVEKGNQISLVCNATGKPDTPQGIDWFFEGKLLATDKEKGIMISKRIESKMLISTLIIKNSQNHDQGYYTCRSTNREAAGIQIHILDVESSKNKKRGEQNSQSSIQDLPSGQHIRVSIMVDNIEHVTTKNLKAVDSNDSYNVPTTSLPSANGNNSQIDYVIIPIKYLHQGTNGKDDPNALNIIGRGAALTNTNSLTLSLTTFTTLILTSFIKLPVR